MSPRRNHPKRDDAPPPLDLDRIKRGVGSVETSADGDWQVRSIPAGAATKTYRCPGCDQEIAPGSGLFGCLRSGHRVFTADGSRSPVP